MIDCRNIVKEYGLEENKVAVLKGVSLSIEKGEYISIIGPSGSGKSTLMHIIGLLDRPTKGEYFLNGRDVSTFSDDELAKLRSKKIGFVFQSFNLLPRATVFRNVSLPLIYDESIPVSERKEIVEKSLRLAGLAEERWTHLSNQLSGGQMQRVAIARALVNNPEIILADEPTGNLDTKTGEIVLNTFDELNKKYGHTIIVITHEREVAEKTKRIIEIRDGVIISDKKR